MKNITLKHLRYACAVADQGHFGRAADMQSVSQPALSMQVKDLEERLGQPLFERGPRMVRPTVFGEDFLQRARAILQSVDDLGDLITKAHLVISNNYMAVRRIARNFQRLLKVWTHFMRIQWMLLMLLLI